METDEPPDERRQEVYTKIKSDEQRWARRESLLTRQLHSETEHSDEDRAVPCPPRAMSTQSTWSNPSAASTAELTSDDGRSVPSPAISPPLLPTTYSIIPVQDKPLERKAFIAGAEKAGTNDKSTNGPEQSVEATLGRKRCVMFACRGKEEAKSKPKTPSPTCAPAPVESAAQSPPKRKCMIKFACPSKGQAETKIAVAGAKRPVSPPPPQRRSSGLKAEGAVKQHRGSDSTVTHASPKSVRKAPAASSSPVATTEPKMQQNISGTSSHDSDAESTEATRFHEFASSEDEPEEWTKEVSCYRRRLTVDDTLQKEIVIRRACEEVEEEAEEEEDEDDEEPEAEAEELDELDDDADDQEDEDAESDHSDAGFHSDDEEGFAASDSEGEDSDYEWWKPGGSSAATSMEQLDRMHSVQHKFDEDVLASSANSVSSGNLSARSFKRRSQPRRKDNVRTHAITIEPRDQADELPDSTDFVCGTLDEDRPLEQAFIDRRDKLEAAKHRARPQDIDPTFPTSDPEMDEEDDDDLVDSSGSDGENMVHGGMDDESEMDGTNTLRRLPSNRQKGKARARSPAPPVRQRSPHPSKRTNKHHSPPPPKHAARSPPPRKLFGGSPRRARSPAPNARMTSPPNTRRSSPSAAVAFMESSKALAERPQLTHTASLPRRGGPLLGRLGRDRESDHENDDVVVPKRGAIDIVKGLEKKRQRRREKMWQKMCAAKAGKGEKAYKVKPGRGCERMREVGLQLQEYHGKAEHILSL